MERRASFKAHAPRAFLPPRLYQPRLRSKCEEENQSSSRTAFLVGFADECGVGEEDSACDSEARDLQKHLDGHRRRLLHLPAAGV